MGDERTMLVSPDGGRITEALDANADADFLSTLVGALMNARGAFLNREDSEWDRVPGRLDDNSLPASEAHPTVITLGYAFNDTVWERLECGSIDGDLLSSYTGLHVEGPIAGVDNSGAATIRLIEGRNFTTDDDVSDTLIGLLTNSRMAVHRPGGNWFAVEGNSLNLAHATQVWNNVEGPYVLSALLGRDSGAGNVVNAVEARNADADADFAAALISLLVSSRGAFLNREDSEWDRLPGRSDDGGLPQTETHPTGLNLLYGYRSEIGTPEWQRVQVELDDGDVPAGEAHLASIGLMHAFDGTNWDRIQVELDNDGISVGERHLASVALLYGDHAGSWRRLDTRTAAGDADFTSTLQGLLTNTRVSFANASGTWIRPRADAMDTANNSAGNPDGIYTISVCYGSDNTGARVWRQVEARNADADADFAAALISLLVSSRGAVFSREVAGDWIRTPARADDDSVPVGEVHPTGIALLHGDHAGTWMRIDANTAADSAAFEGEEGLVVNSRLAIVANTGGSWSRLEGDVPSNANVTAHTAVMALYANAICFGLQGTTLREINAGDFNADADVTSSLMALMVNARNAVYDRDAANWARMPARTDDGSLPVGEVQPTGVSFLHGFNNSSWVRVRQQTAAAANIAAANEGILVNARIGIFNRGSGAYEFPEGEDLDSVSGVNPAGVLGAYAAALAVGLDNTAAAVLRPVEARNDDADADVAASLIGLTVNNRNSVLVGGGDWVREHGIRSTGPTAVVDPGASAVLASLDTVECTHKTIFVNASVSATVRLQVSVDNSAWRTLEDVLSAASGDAFASDLALQRMRGYRYVRLLNVNGLTGTVTVEITAQR